MKGREKAPHLLIREVPFLALIVFWAVYAGIELFNGRFDVISSVTPVGLFLLVYILARWVLKYPGR
jgi:hypothetical protein